MADLTLLLDCETTGLIENRMVKDDRLPEIIELYACLADTRTGEVLEELDTLVRPRSLNWDPKIVKITGITQAMVMDAKPFVVAADPLIGMIKRAKRVVAHNCSFDCEVVDVEYERLGFKVHWPEKVCTVEQTIHLKGHRLSLGGLHEHLFGEKFEGAHRAKVDVMALLRCVVEMEKRGML